MQEITVSQNVSRNLVFSGISAFSNIFVFILAVVAARILGVEDFGKYAFGLAFVEIFLIFMDIGLNELVVREIARKRENAATYLAHILVIKAILSAITLLFIWLIINSLNYSQEVKNVVYILALATIIKSYQLSFRAFFRALGYFEFEAMVINLERIVLLIGGLIILLLRYGLIAFCLIFIVVRLINIFIPYWLLTKKIGLMVKRKIYFSLLKKLIRSSSEFALSIILISIFFRINTIMLSLLRGHVEVGYYNSAFQILVAIMILPRIICEGLFPVLSVSFLKSKGRLFNLFRIGAKYMIILSFPIAMCGAILAKQLILLMFGQQYLASVEVFRILLPSCIFLFLTDLGGTMLASINKQYMVVVFSLLSVVLNIVLNYVMITRYGYLGAGIATLITSVFFFFLLYGYLYMRNIRISWSKIILRPFIATIIVGLFIFLLQRREFFVIFSAACIIYLGLLSAFGTWDNQEIDKLKIFLKIICGNKFQFQKYFSRNLS